MSHCLLPTFCICTSWSSCSDLVTGLGGQRGEPTPTSRCARAPAAPPCPEHTAGLTGRWGPGRTGSTPRQHPTPHSASRPRSVCGCPGLSHWKGMFITRDPGGLTPSELLPCSGPKLTEQKARDSKQVSKALLTIPPENAKLKWGRPSPLPPLGPWASSSQPSQRGFIGWQQTDAVQSTRGSAAAPCP